MPEHGTATPGGRAINYWWGLKSGAERVEYPTRLNDGTMQLLKMAERQLCDGEIQVFPTESYSQGHALHHAASGIYTPKELMEMDWLEESVEGELPSTTNWTPRPAAFEHQWLDNVKERRSNRQRPKDRKEWSKSIVKILAISDVPSKLLWDESVRKRLEGIDLILSCGDLPKKYLEYLTNFTTVPILYVHGNHDGSYKESEPGGCICVDDAVYVWKGLRIMGLGGCNRYNRDDTFQYTEAEMRRRARKLWLAARRAGGIDILLTHAPASGLNDGTDKAHKGFQVFNDLMDQYQPKWFIHGHMHLNYGANLPRVCTRGGTTVINATERYEFEIPDPVQVPKRKLFGWG